MAKISWITNFHATSQVIIEDWFSACSLLHEKLLEAGLVQSDDTGQINFATHTRPGALPSGQFLGHKIYRSDCVGAPSVFLKVEYGVASSPGDERGIYALRLSMALSTNGAGLLVLGTPPVVVGARIDAASMRTAGALNAPSMVCSKNGFLGVVWGLGYFIPYSSGPSSTPPDAPTLASFFLVRNCDDAGGVLPSGVSLVVIAPGGRSLSDYGAPPMAIHLSSESITTVSSNIALALGADSVSTVSGAVPSFNMHTMTPEPRRVNGVMCISRNAAQDGDEMLVAAVGETSRNYIILRKVWPADMTVGKNTKACIGMLWEA